jgi:RHS repeat-associated protein
VVTTTVYDNAGRITSITHAKAGTTLLGVSYGYDNADRRTSATTTGEGTATYGYDELNRLTSASYPGGPNVGYTYDKAGNRLTETRGAATTTATYDAAGQMTARGGITYTYDQAGNLTQAGSDTYGWDAEGRLTSVTRSGHSATYRYDGDGIRTRTTVDGTTNDLLVDRTGGLPEIVDDGTAGYLQAPGMVAKVTASGATDGLTDALGSVRGTTDASGTLTGRRSYEAFGSTLASSGTSLVFGFTGAPSDATGLVDLRARSLDPVSGRFLSPDSVIPNAPGTQGYSPYAYVANNPMNWTDPSGHQVDGTGVGEPSFLAYITAIAISGGQWIAAACGAAPLGCVVLVSLLVVACVLAGPCFEAAQSISRLFTDGGSTGDANQLTDEEDATDTFPEAPPEPQPTPLPVPCVTPAICVGQDEDAGDSDIVFRGSARTYNNLTPTPGKDTIGWPLNGLSTYSDLTKACGATNRKAQGFSLKMIRGLGVFLVTPDPKEPGHYYFAATTMDRHDEWSLSKDAVRNDPQNRDIADPLARLLYDNVLIVDQPCS